MERLNITCEFRDYFEIAKLKWREEFKCREHNVKQKLSERAGENGNYKCCNWRSTSYLPLWGLACLLWMMLDETIRNGDFKIQDSRKLRLQSEKLKGM